MHFWVCFGQRCEHFLRSVLVEMAYLQIEICGIYLYGFYAAGLDDRSSYRDYARISRTLAQNRERNAAVGLASRMLDRLFQRQSGNVDVAEPGDEVPGLQAGTKCGGILVRRDDLHGPLLQADLNAEAAENAAGLPAQFV